MLIFDSFKKNDAQLRVIALVVLGGLGVLLAGLWWVQVVSAQDYQESLETQSFRTVRIPAVRGKILDRNGVVLAENRPIYNLSLYLEELRQAFDAAYFQQLAQARAQLKLQMEQQQRTLKRKLTKQERKQFILSAAQKGSLRQKARYEVASNVVRQVSQRLQQPLWLNPTNFERHYETRLALPYPVLLDLDPTNIARFEEQSTSSLGVDLEVQSTRVYPHQTTAAHVLGCLRHDDSSAEGEESFVSYRLPDFRGDLGVEYGFDTQLRGMAGAKSVLVNNMGYRQTENVWISAAPGTNVVLTIDLHIQQAAERALRGVFGPNTRGAVVVLEVQSGDILALASSPTLNPNQFIQGLSAAEHERLTDPRLRPQINRATQENYAPGSIFKLVVGLAALEAGLDPDATLNNPGYILVGRRPIHDLAAPGLYDFKKALKISSNTYFIANGLRTGIERIMKLGQQLHLGERTELRTRQEAAGIFPSSRTVRAGWSDGDTANICIGQGRVAVTPLQVAVLTAAIANGGKVLWPRLVQRLEPQDPAAGWAPVVFPSGRVRNELGVTPRNLKILRDAMLADVEDADGTGRRAAVAGLRICGKTGTAQVMNERNQLIGDTVWFTSFAPYDDPRYAVVVMVEVDPNTSTGGGTCAPLARTIYTALQDRERTGASKTETLAKTN